MDHLTLDGRLGENVEIDLCFRCRAFWFDPFEELHLTPASTLRLFRLIAEKASPTAPGQFPRISHCPKCDCILKLAHDRQRNTPFQYWRCEREHGRFVPFIDFLREKDFIRPLTPAQLAELRSNVGEIHCSNCGAPIDLTHASSCEHCGSPITMVDMKQLSEMAKDIPQTAAVPPLVPPQEHGHVDTLFAQRTAMSSDFSLIDLGLQALADWFRVFPD